MKSIDVKSLIICFLMCALIFTIPGFSSGNNDGRFQLTNYKHGDYSAHFIIDTQTGNLKPGWYKCSLGFYTINNVPDTTLLKNICYDFGSKFYSDKN